jgi:cephalosporin hydroxylase
MSFGERAVLQGILSELKPRVSIEIGSAQGGSLQWVARHSESVHSIDLTPPVEILPNVSYHTGDSRRLLPELLDPRCLLIHKGIVDFALIDGDHTAEGVHADLRHLLDSPACRRTVILLHDATNTDVRDGITIAVHEHPAIVYRDLDFTRGYVFAEGPFAGQRWGGIGLVITGDPATDGYGHTPAQTLYR